MSLEYSFDVGYGFAIRPEDTEIIEALSKDLGDADLPILGFGLDYEKFNTEYPLLKFATSGNDGVDESLIIMLAGTHHDLEGKYSGKSYTIKLRDADLVNEELAQLITFARKYGLQGSPSWIAYTAIR